MRANIERARKELLIMDEPAEALDQHILDDMFDLILEYLAASSCALLLVSHRQDERAVLRSVIGF